MSKTKSKAMTTVTVNPRTRMKQIRSIVADAHKDGQRIDLLKLSGDDIARSQIALQDLLTKEQQKHSKARGHIVDQKHIINIITEMSKFMSDASVERILNDQDRLAKLSSDLNHEKTLHEKLLTEYKNLSLELKNTKQALDSLIKGKTNE